MKKQSFYFANYRLLTDVDWSQWAECDCLDDFASLMPYQDTFALHCVIEPHIEELLSAYSRFPLIAETAHYLLRKTSDDRWVFLTPSSAHSIGKVLLALPDYGEMTLHVENWQCRIGKHENVCCNPEKLPFSSIIRCCCEAGMTLRGGIPMHAALVGKDGEGVLFLGPSGMGKSTQAKLWHSHLGADFISGDRPGLRFIDGKWYAFGMPWDGKDGLFRQRGVPLKGVVVLGQAKENRIRRITVMEAQIALLRQAIVPAWDDRALDSMIPLISRLSADIPFYHLCCLPEPGAAELTFETLFRHEVAQ